MPCTNTSTIRMAVDKTKWTRSTQERDEQTSPRSVLFFATPFRP